MIYIRQFEDLFIPSLSLSCWFTLEERKLLDTNIETIVHDHWSDNTLAEIGYLRKKKWSVADELDDSFVSLWTQLHHSPVSYSSRYDQMICEAVQLLMIRPKSYSTHTHTHRGRERRLYSVGHLTWQTKASTHACATDKDKLCRTLHLIHA